tara:strand:+ start:794 stop:1027 length:234 start_codon:yes stop_codon:yes gene_type:complete
MEEDDSLEIEFTPEEDESALDVLQAISGRRITHVELLEDNTQSMIKICFSKNVEDYLLIHAEGANLYLVKPAPKSLH